MNVNQEKRKRSDKDISFRVYKDSTHVRVSKTTKARLNITIHPYLKEEFKIICADMGSSVAEEIEKYIRIQVEKKEGKKLIFR